LIKEICIHLEFVLSVLPTVAQPSQQVSGASIPLSDNSRGNKTWIWTPTSSAIPESPSAEEIIPIGEGEQLSDNEPEDDDEISQDEEDDVEDNNEKSMKYETEPDKASSTASAAGPTRDDDDPEMECDIPSSGDDDGPASSSSTSQEDEDGSGLMSTEFPVRPCYVPPQCTEPWQDQFQVYNAEIRAIIPHEIRRFFMAYESKFNKLIC
jgi:hypothetical protein